MHPSFSIQGFRDAGLSSSFQLPLPAGLQRTLRSEKPHRFLQFGFHFLMAYLITIGLGYRVNLIGVTAGALGIHVLSRLQSVAVYRILVGFWMIVAGLYYPFGRAYGPPTYNTMVVLHATNMEESTDFIALLPYSAYVMSPLILGLGIFVLRQKRTEKPIWTHWDTLLGVLGVLLWYYEPFAAHRFVGSLIVHNRAFLLEQRRLLEMTREEPTWRVLSSDPKYHTYVMVLGESVRRDALGAFGGHWDNTPWASSVNATILMNYVAAAGSTQLSLSRTLNRVVDDQPQVKDSFIALANAAGFQTSWFSNHQQLHEWSTAVSGIAARSHRQVFLRTKTDLVKEYADDNKLLPLAERVLQEKREKPQLIILHLLGSHPRACSRTQEQYQEYIVSEETSCYLYSVTMADQFLNQTHQLLKQYSDSFSLLYMGDHGLKISAMGKAWQYLHHGDDFKENFEVPFMVTSSDHKEREILKARRSARDWLQFFAQWTGIEAEGIPTKAYRFLSEDSMPGKTIVKTFDQADQDYDKLPSNPFPTKRY